MVNTTRLIQDDIPEVKTLKNVKIEMPDEDDVLHYIISVRVGDGFYKDHWFRFNFIITPDWPYTRPIVTILDDIWHVNIKLTKDGGNVCISTLSDEEYTPSVTLLNIVESLKFLLVNPNEKDPLNVDAAKQYKENPDAFEKKVDYYLDKMEE